MKFLKAIFRCVLYSIAFFLCAYFATGKLDIIDAIVPGIVGGIFLVLVTSE